MRRLLPLLLLVLTACSDSGGDAEPSATPAARVVVAVLDTSLNPYHEFFYGGSPIYADAAPAGVTPAVLAELGVGPDQQLTLTRSGDLAADLAADATLWSRIERGRPYWFKGTNLIAISNCEAPLPPLQPSAEKNPHGTGTSAAALKANPQAVILFYEGCARPDAEELSYVLEHPAVDIVNLSYNDGLPLPVPATYRGVVELGKLVFQSASNYPLPTPLQGGPGSWWTIGVSGFDEQGAGGQILTAGLLPDFVANFTDELPFCMDCESGLLRVSGTSLSSPQAAGLTSRVVLEARRLLGHRGGIDPGNGAPALIVDGERRISNWDLRRALEDAAYVDYDASDYRPTLNSDLPPVNALPINPLAPWLQLAWGDLSLMPDKAVVDAALSGLGLGTTPRDKAPGYCSFMATQMRLRQAAWDAIATSSGSGERVPATNPYRFCSDQAAMP